MVKNPFKVKSSSSEHFERLRGETCVGGLRTIAGGELFAVCLTKTVQMENKRKWWKFYLLPAGSPKEITKRGTWVVISCIIAGVLFKDGVIRVLVAIISCYGLALLIIARLMPLLAKLKDKCLSIDRKYIYYVLIVLLLIGVGYWLLVRPSNVRASCSKKAGEITKTILSQDVSINEARTWYDLSYIACLRKAGIKG